MSTEDKNVIYDEAIRHFPFHEGSSVFETQELYELRLKNNIDKVFSSLETQIHRGISVLKRYNIDWIEEGYEGYSEKTLENCFFVAEKLIKEGAYQDAISVLYVLIGLDPCVGELWLTLGNANFFQKKYPEAIQAYSFAANFLGPDIRPYAYIAQCYKELQEYPAAQEVLQAALKILTEHPEQKSTWHESLVTLQQELQAKKEGSHE